MDTNDVKLLIGTHVVIGGQGGFLHITETVLHSSPVLHFTDSQGSMHVTISISRARIRDILDTYQLV